MVVEIRSGADAFRLNYEKGGVGTISSNLHSGAIEDRVYDAAIDGVESMILAQAIAGVEVTWAEYQKGVWDAVNAIANKM